MKKKVKILYIGNKLSRYGFTPGVIETLGPLLEKEDYAVIYAGTRKNPFLRLTEILWKTATTGRQVDYILIDTYSTSAFWYAYFAGTLAKIISTKYIPILHGGDLPKRLKRSNRACDKLFYNSYANIAVSGYLNHEFEKAGYRTVVIPNSIEISKYPFRLRDQPRPKLLWVRSFHRQYNPLMAADVLAGLLQIHPDAELCMVGPDKDGSLGEFKDYIRQKGTEEHVKITGKLSKEDWISLSENYDFFINTTNVDNTPVSVIEAMALGLCVISTNPGGIPFLVQDGVDAKLVNPQNSSLMIRTVDYLLKNPEDVVQLSVNARKKAEQFDVNVIIPAWKDLLS
ncbi:MAG TPA: glycosyltransferase family 4 protein [Bacteroidales bacterium]|nr:glycosyltransferase family 4 protein [Bacteroidales bacterium]